MKDACDLWTHEARAGARTGNAQARMGAGATFGPSEASRAVLACCELMRSPLVESSCGALCMYFYIQRGAATACGS